MLDSLVFFSESPSPPRDAFPPQQMCQLSSRELGARSATLQFSSDRNYPEVVQRPQVRGSVSETGLTSDTSGKGWGSPGFCYTARGSQHTRLRLDNKAPDLPPPAWCKEHSPGTARWESCRGQGMGEWPLGGHPPSTPMFTDQQLPDPVS